MFRIRFKMPQKKDPLIKILPVIRGRYLQNISLARHTWFGVGGNAEIMYIPEDAGDLAHFLRNKPHNVPVCLIGGGSNLLVRDGGVPGVVIKLDNASFQKVTVGNGTITCGAGFRNIDLKKHLLKHELGGLEFLCSIPGVIGGSVKTNAGCFGREVADVMQSAEIMNGRPLPRPTWGCPTAAACSPTTGSFFPSLLKPNLRPGKKSPGCWKNTSNTAKPASPITRKPPAPLSKTRKG